mgnify:FL=1
MNHLYAPPYDSPIEDLFAKHYTEWAAPGVNLTPQEHVNTICGLFILDFVISTPDGYRVAVECDGKEFHDESRDEWRDGMILGEGAVDAIYRLRGEDINFRLDEVLYVLLRLEPSIFAAKAEARFTVLASPEVVRLSYTHDVDSYTTRFARDVDRGFLHLEARRRVIPVGQRRFWNTAFAYAASVNGGRLDDVIDQFRRQNGRNQSH